MAGGRAPRVLVIDDDPQVRLLISMILEDEGLAVEAAMGGAEALRLATEQPPALVVLDMSLPDMTVDDLARVIPSKSTRILIYCNNNFLNEPDAFRSKNLRASLNVYTFNVLHSYGYTNVYELGPLLDIEKTRIPFEGQLARR